MAKGPKKQYSRPRKRTWARKEKKDRRNLKLWAEGARESILQPHLAGYMDALERGWRAERDYLREVCNEFHARISWRVADDEEPDDPLPAYDPMVMSRPVPFPGLLPTFPRSPIPLRHWTSLPVHPVDPSDTPSCIPICFRPIRPSCPGLLTRTPTSRSILLHYTTPSSPHRSFCSTMELSRSSGLDLDFTFAFSMPFRPMTHFPVDPSDSEECLPEFLTVPLTSSDFCTVCRSPNPIGIQVDSAPIALLLSIPLPLCSPRFAHVLD
ncbi:hypothetical protein R3P38DRAFT_2797855 [Favolaschia claudopus]|uniref:Ribosomal protein L32 n=1 Tax=Favolaschia claudopus TaxID=2862362 RepID=A0AAW0A2L5_9AGAR